MTDYQPTSGGDDVHALSGAYAVDALEPDERARFEAHLRQCADCRDEVDSLREAAAVLGTDDLAPPASLRDRLLADIATIRPLPPLMAEDAAPRAETPSAVVVQLDSRRRSVARIPLFAAAAAVIVAAVGGLWVRSDDEPPAPEITAEQVLAAADASSTDKSFPDGATAVVTVSRSLARSVIHTDDMRAAPEGKDYQLWLQTPAGVMEPAGVMPDLRDATVLLDGDASTATGVGITVEPDGGSERPSSEPIAVFPLGT
ncbi:MAG: anti-sigma factor [Propionibacteriales bacterium]|nr:anti-sigma factor [Propionibacteriales bacterium]